MINSITNKTNDNINSIFSNKLKRFSRSYLNFRASLIKADINSKVTNIKALSLLEVLVVLGIVSFTLVSTMSLILRANAIIKDNEIQDSANDILLQAFELFKSPEEIKVLQTGIGGYSDLLTTLKTTYTLEFESLANRNGYLQKTLSTNIGECTNDNEFNIESLGDSNRPYPICVKVSITPERDSPTGPIVRYLIELNLSYILTSGVVSENYQLIRYENFIQIQ